MTLDNLYLIKPPMDPKTTAAAAPAAPADDFESVFAEITKLGDDGKEPESVPAAVVKTPEEIAAEVAAAAAAAVVKTPEEIAAEAAAAAAVVKTPEEIAAEATAAAEAAAAAAAAEPTAEQKRITELEAALEAAKKPPSAAKTPEEIATEAAAATAAAAPPEIEWYKPSADEAAVLEAYKKDWPEISKAEELRTKMAVYNAVKYTLAEVAQTYGPVIDKFNKTSDAIAEHLQLLEIRGDHSDYDKLQPKVVEWVETLPAAFRAGARLTMESGTPEEVSSLVAEYKKQHPEPAATTAAPAAAAAPARTGLSEAAKKAAGKLTVVDSKRTTQATAADPNDFDAAWAEASAAK